MRIIELICETCGTFFEVEYFNRHHKYCSKECYHKSPTKGRPPNKEKKKCIVCENPIPLVNQRFCNSKCRSIYWTGRERNIEKFIPDEKTCPICNNTFLVGGKGNRKRTNIYCSTKCSGIGQQKNIEDSKTPTRSRMWHRLRKEIFLERGIRCEFCNNIDKKSRIQLHHIIPEKIYKNYDKENLMLLCLKCHVIIEHLTKIGYEQNKNNFDPRNMIQTLKTLLYN